MQLLNVQVKCPSSMANQETIAVPYLENVGGEQKLVRKSKHYYQVQAQILICNKQYCDFVVWNQNNVLIERIFKDQELCNEIIEKAVKFHETCVMPEMVFKYFTKSEGVNDASLLCVESTECENTDAYGVVSVGAEAEVSLNATYELEQTSISEVHDSSVVENDAKYCLCNTGDDGSLMIMCENRLCSRKWFHCRCLGITDVPKDAWFCDSCT